MHSTSTAPTPETNIKSSSMPKPAASQSNSRPVVSRLPQAQHGRGAMRYVLRAVGQRDRFFACKKDANYEASKYST